MNFLTHNFLAVSAMDKLKVLPPDVWLKIGLFVGIIILSVYMVRAAAKVNKVIGGVVILVTASVFFFSWVYNRNEPKFLTPLIERIAPFFPSAGAYAAKQQTLPK